MILVPLSIYNYGFRVKFSYRTVSILFLQAFTGTFLFRTLLFYGLNWTSASACGLITSSTPVIVALLALVILREKFTWNKILGIVLTVTGIATVNTMTSSGAGSDTLTGNLLVFLAVLGEAMFSIFSKLYREEVSPILKTTVICFFALLCFIPFSINDLATVDLLKVDYRIWFYLMYYGIFVTVVAFILWFIGISQIPASTSAVFSGFIPLTSIVLAAFVLDEKITLFHVLSLVLIIMGLITAIKPSFYTPFFSVLRSKFRAT